MFEGTMFEGTTFEGTVFTCSFEVAADDQRPLSCICHVFVTYVSCKQAQLQLSEAFVL